MQLKSLVNSRVKKVLLVVLCLVLLSQIPFAYRRYRLGRLNARIQKLNSEIRQIESKREQPPGSSVSGYEDYIGVIHVHSFLGGHSSGTFQEIIEAAGKTGLDFVVMTEHVEGQFDTSAMTLKGTHGGTLFINGNEVSSEEGDRLLSIPGNVMLMATKLTTRDVVANSRARSALSIVAYPQEFKTWSERYDGIEIYNVFTNAQKISPVVAFFDSVWSRRSYPDLIFANYLERPSAAIGKWDELSKSERVFAIAGNDAHSNVGVSLKDSTDKEIVGIKLDPYETSFRLVRVHVLISVFYQHGVRLKPALDEATLLKAMRAGNFFMGFDLLGNTSSFRFEARNGDSLAIQGDEIPLRAESTLKVTFPITARMVLYKDGKVLLDENGVLEKEVKIGERGVYRVEVYQPSLGKPFSEMPWIISNPIYVR